LPGAMGIMAASMGVTIAELDKMMKKGEVLSEEVMPGFARAVEIAFGLQTIEKVETLQASIGRLKGGWELFVNYVINSESQVSDFISTIADGVSVAVAYITKQLGSEEANMLMDLAKFQASWLKSWRESTIEKLGLADEIEDIRLNLIELDKVKVGKTGDALKGLEQQISDLQKRRLDIEDIILATQKKQATDELAKKGAIYAQDKKAYDLKLESIRASKLFVANAKKEASEGKLSEDDFKKAKTIELGVIPKLNDELETLRINLLTSESAYRNFLKFAETGNEGGDTITTPDGTMKTLKEATDRQLEVERERVKENQTANEKIIAMDTTTYDEKERLMLENLDLEKRVGGISLEIFKRNRKKKLEEDIAKVEGVPDNLTEGGGDAKKANIEGLINEANQQVQAAELKHNSKMNQIETRGVEQSIALVKEKIDRELMIYDTAQNEKIAKAKEQFNTNVTGLNSDLDSGKIQKPGYDKAILEEKKRFEDEMTQLEFDGVNARIELQVKLIEAYLISADIQGDALLAAEALIAKIRSGLKTMTVGDDGEDIKPIDPDEWKMWFQEIGQAAADFFASIQDLGNALFDARIQKIDEEIEANERKYERLFELAKNDEAETKILERNKKLREDQLAKEKKRLQIKQAKFDKALAITTATIQGAVAVVNASTATPPPLGIILAAITGAAVAVQIAAIAAKPIPAFAKGGIMGYDGKAQINDGGNQEFVERNGAILTTKQNNAIVDLKKGDIIHKDYQTLNRKSMILSSMANGGELTENDFNRMYAGIEGSIEKGFNKAKINNRVTVLNKVDTYRDKMQNWS